MANFILVTDGTGAPSRRISILINDEGYRIVSVETIKHYYPNAIGLEYLIGDQPCGPTIMKGNIRLPPDQHEYEVLYPASKNLPISGAKQRMQERIMNTIEGRDDSSSELSDAEFQTKPTKKLKGSNKTGTRILKVGWKHRKSVKEPFKQINRPLGGVKEVTLRTDKKYYYDEVLDICCKLNEKRLSLYILTTDVTTNDMSDSVTTESLNANSQGIGGSAISDYEKDDKILVKSKQHANQEDFDGLSSSSRIGSSSAQYRLQKILMKKGKSQIPKLSNDNRLMSTPYMSPSTRSTSSPPIKTSPNSEKKKINKGSCTVTSASNPRKIKSPRKTPYMSPFIRSTASPPMKTSPNSENKKINKENCTVTLTRNLPKIKSPRKNFPELTPRNNFEENSLACQPSEPRDTSSHAKGLSSFSFKEPGDTSLEIKSIKIKGSNKSIKSSSVSRGVLDKSNVGDDEETKELALSIPELQLSDIEIPPENDKEHLLGSGSYGYVVKARLNDDIVAVKCIKMQLHTNRKYVIREIAIMDKLRHKNIAQISAYIFDMFKVYIVMEYVPGANLQKILSIEYFRYRYKADVSIRTSRISEMPDELESTVDNSAIKGTLLYMPPELLMENVRASPKPDCWSTACVVTEIYTEREIWTIKNPPATYLKMIHNFETHDIPDLDGVPEPLKAILK
ncbi:hypothetical protein QAD02_007724 [Eretmocerus hayati]|uniref:Uncharacterized protein n=1 Tax=Eretmocerus hayati TaxID=131215 RepID=A0ACC2N4H5_9HYME|nr:hypothetical protein QAD02_007724 [Eretmocerus hayati]